MQKSIYSFKVLFLHRKNEKAVKAFLFNILTFHYDRCDRSQSGNITRSHLHFHFK